MWPFIETNKKWCDVVASIRDNDFELILFIVWPKSSQLTPVFLIYRWMGGHKVIARISL
jgi:hypothetical protein